MGTLPLMGVWAIHQVLHCRREAPMQLLWRVLVHLHTGEHPVRVAYVAGDAAPGLAGQALWGHSASASWGLPNAS
jgi:hypothetical protein